MKKSSHKKWQLRPTPPEDFFEKFPELPRTIAALLYYRDLTTQAQIDEFLSPDYAAHVHDPFLFKDMTKAVGRIMQAIANDERITVHGDYDADGVSSAVIMTSLFRALKFTNFSIFLPHRETDGYGLNLKTVQLLASENTKLIISCDCGISNAPEVELANSLGVDVIVTDHHSIPAVIPPAYAIIHPKLPGETYPDQTLCGGAVAFKLAQGILRTHQATNELLPDEQRHEALEKWLLDMVAIASVADMVPLLGESRTLTKYGLIVLNKTKRIGLQKLLLEARLMETDGTLKRAIDADTIGFRIAPQINAAGRMGHANVAYKLLVAESGTDAVDLAWELNNNNTDRQKKTEEYVAEAIKQINAAPEAPVLFVFSKNWATGIVGLIASRLKEKFGKPVIAMTDNQGEVVGSGRSVTGFNLIAAMQAMPELFLKFGGHPMACGFTLKTPETQAAFKEQLTAAFALKSGDLDLTPCLDVDAELDLDNVDWELYDLLDKFKPFGQCNPRPRYLARGVTVVGIQAMGKDAKHIRLMLKHKSNRVRKTVGWNLCGANASTDWCEVLRPGDQLDILYEIDVNEWNGSRELQILITDLRKAELTEPIV